MGGDNTAPHTDDRTIASRREAGNRKRKQPYPIAALTIELMPHPILTEQQSAELHDQVARRLRWMNRLRDRMIQLGFAPTDPLLGATMKARDSMQDLLTEVHYCSMPGGLGDRGG